MVIFEGPDPPTPKLADVLRHGQPHPGHVATALTPDVQLTGANVHVTDVARTKPFVARVGPRGAGSCAGIFAV